MGMTIAEKIIAAAAGVDSVKPGDIHTVQLDRLMSNDGTTHLTVDMYNNKLKNPQLVFVIYSIIIYGCIGKAIADYSIDKNEAVIIYFCIFSYTFLLVLCIIYNIVPFYKSPVGSWIKINKRVLDDVCF